MSTVHMSTVESKDGTRIAFSRAGDGPPVILVDGALCDRKFGPSTRLAALLARHFTVFTYDRRGREAAATRSHTPPSARSRTSKR